jgi:adenylate kinase family enzyme
MAEEDSWIIDGNYRSSIDVRLTKADTIIFLDYPKWRCLWRAFKRVLNRKQPFDKTEGVKAKIDWQLVKFIITYPQHEMRARIENYQEGRKVFVARNDRGIAEILRLYRS